MKKFLINTFLVFSIAVLLISLILLTLVFLWENRSVIANNFGINLKDNCKVSDLQIQCGYLNIQSEEFSVKLSDIKLRADILKFLKKSEPFLFVNINRGKIYIKSEKKKKRKEKNPLNYAFFLIYFVKSDINRLDIYADLPSGKFSLKDFSFLSSYNSFYIKRPFYFAFGDFSGKVTDFSGDIQLNSISVKKSRAIINENILTGWGSFDYEGNFSFKGSFEGEKLNTGSILLENFHILFSVNRYKDILNGNSRIVSDSLRINSFFAKYTESRIKFSGKNRFDGKVHIKADSFQLNKIRGNNLLYTGNIDFSFKKRFFRTGGSLSISSILYDRLSAATLNSDITVAYKNRTFKAKGRASLGDLALQFLYADRILTVSSKGMNLKKAFSLYRPVDIDGTVWGKAVFNFEKGDLSLELDGRELNIYGIYFRKGKIISDFSIENKSGRFSLSLKNEDSFCFITGKLLKGSVDADVTFDNINTEGFIYGKRYGFGGIIDGTGKIYGSIPDLSVSLQGTAHYFHYKNLPLKNTQFQFLFENTTKNIRLSFKKGNTDGLLTLKLEPFSLYLSLDFKDSDISKCKRVFKEKMPAVFRHITPKTATGTSKNQSKGQILEYKNRDR
ncbi:MAG: hypothetical protein Q9M89_08955 [Persephonella sp.]|nr:hypothetical protein [Persephonella sp.]